MADPRTKLTYKSINALKNMGPASHSEIKFILDRHPFEDEDNLPSPTDDWIIDGRLLLNSPIYKDGALRIQMIIPTSFPFDPPKVFLKTPVFHPNVSREGNGSFSFTEFT